MESVINIKDLRDKYINDFKKNNRYTCLNNLKIKKSEFGKNKNNLGVFTKKKIYKNELIECSPIIKLYERAKKQSDPVINDYAFTNTENCNCYQCINYGSVMYIGLGYSSIYNSISDRNSAWTISSENNLWMNIALKDINEEEEIFI